jgi:hypothetical protein
LVVVQVNYLSARWPGDAYLFARRFASLLERAGTRERAARPHGAGGYN